MKNTLLFVLLLSGCSYNTPVMNVATYEKTVSGDAHGKVVQALTAMGFAIASDQNGAITTSPKTMRLSEHYADCGNIWGLPYVKDTRTILKVSYFVSLAGSKATVTTNIDGTFNATAVGGSKVLACQSTGKLETALLDKL